MNRRGLPDGVVTMSLEELLTSGARDPILFTRYQAEGAIPNGARVRKSSSDPGDAHAVGSLATVLGSLGPLEGEFGYFVLWDDLAAPVFVVGRKLERVEAG